ncbi:MAG: hypothetical protein AABW67_03715 [Nanoarchaeota archaeon]|mgnify:CR=1 FL=1
MSKLSSKIERLEKEIKEYLEFTNFMTNVKFHNQSHYLAVEYKPFNHEGIKKILSDCCDETLNKIKQNNHEIEKITYKDNGLVYIRKLIINPLKKHDKISLGYRILCELKQDIDSYFLRHANEIDKYKKLIEKRCKIKKKNSIKISS